MSVIFFVKGYFSRKSFWVHCLVFLVILLIAIVLALRYSPASVSEYKAGDSQNASSTDTAVVSVATPVATHIATPPQVKGIYVSACGAASQTIRKRIEELLRDTEINSVVIDIKDYSGTVSFKTGNATIDSIEGPGCTAPDMKVWVEQLHERGVYVIGRVTVFQDPVYTKLYPEVAVKRKDGVSIWRDKKGLAFIDVSSPQYWDHVVALATSSYSAGFDEINFDYIRYPSDGNMADTHYQNASTSKRENLRKFFEYIDISLRGTGIVTSADLFGMVTTNTDDLNIGQILEYGLLHFDYVAPMIYPSHYPKTYHGWSDPNQYPYELILYNMSEAIRRAEFLRREIGAIKSEALTSIAAVGAGGDKPASTSLPIYENPDKYLVERANRKQLRPWLQDFDYPVPYTAQMVRAQIEATYASGLDSFMLWDPSNRYTKSALLGKREDVSTSTRAGQ